MAWGHAAWHPLEGLDVADEDVRAVDEIVWMRIRGRASGRVLFVIARVTGLHRMQIFVAQDAPTAFGAMFPLADRPCSTSRIYMVYVWILACRAC